jgi:hypothetical protein
MAKEHHKKEHHKKEHHKKEHYAKGGVIKKSKIDATHEDKEEIAESKQHMHKKRGGKVVKMEGHKPKHNPAKKARGGSAMSANSAMHPLTGADPKVMREGFGKTKQDKEGD